MFRIILPLILALAGCATTPSSKTSSTPSDSDPMLLAMFFGPGAQRTISPVIRCPVRCQKLP